MGASFRKNQATRQTVSGKSPQVLITPAIYRGSLHPKVTTRIKMRGFTVTHFGSYVKCSQKKHGLIHTFLLSIIYLYSTGNYRHDFNFHSL